MDMAPFITSLKPHTTAKPACWAWPNSSAKQPMNAPITNRIRYGVITCTPNRYSTARSP